MAGSRVAGEEGVVEEQHGNDSVLPKGVEDELASVFPGKLEMHQRKLGRIHANTYTVPTVSLLCLFASSLRSHVASSSIVPAPVDHKQSFQESELCYRKVRSIHSLTSFLS